MTPNYLWLFSTESFSAWNIVARNKTAKLDGSAVRMHTQRQSTSKPQTLFPLCSETHPMGKLCKHKTVLTASISPPGRFIMLLDRAEQQQKDESMTNVDGVLQKSVIKENISLCVLATQLSLVNIQAIIFSVLKR